MDILTLRGKRLVGNVIGGLFLVCSTSAITTIYIQTEYMGHNTIKDFINALNLGRPTLDNVVNDERSAEVPLLSIPVKHRVLITKEDVVKDIIGNVQPNLQLRVESVERPKKDTNKTEKVIPVNINTPVYTVTSELKQAIYSYESDNNTSAFSRSGRHSGLCQMGDKALVDVGYKGDRFAFAKENNQTQDEYCTKRFKYIIVLLKKNKLEPTISSVYTVHQQGYGNGLKILLNKKVPSRANIISNITDKYLLEAWNKQTAHYLNRGLK